SSTSVPVAHHPTNGAFDVPIEVRPDIRAALAAGGTDEPRLNIRQSHVVRPVVGIHGDGMAALVVGAIDQDPAHAHLAHFAKGDLLGALPPSKRRAGIPATDF